MFVSRVVFDRLSRVLDEARDELREQRAYNRALVQQIVEMRQSGFAPPPKVAPPALSSALDDAIIAKANGNARLRAHLMRERDKLRKQQIPDDEITERLTTFRDPDPDE